MIHTSFMNGPGVHHRVRKLPKEVVDRIAAGEVVQRPVNVVKELLENALDAVGWGGNLITNPHIQIEIRDAGLGMIAVTDNGSGIHPDDFPLLAERYCTSKLRDVEELDAVTTRGFRGEALASISYVSQLSIASRRADSEIGTKGEFRDSKLVHSHRTATAVGTRVTVSALFANIPNRLSGLAKPSAELKRIAVLVRNYAIHCRGVKFTFSGGAGSAVDGVPAQFTVSSDENI